MNPDDITVIVQQPFDWLGALVVPIAAILVSSCIAIALFRREAAAIEKAKLRDSLAEISRELLVMARATSWGTQSEANDSLTRVMANVNALAFHVRKEDVDVLRFFTAVLTRSVNSGDAGVVGTTASWLATALEAWARGDLTADDFRANMPEASEEMWQTHVVLKDWETITAAPPHADEPQRA